MRKSIAFLAALVFTGSVLSLPCGATTLINDGGEPLFFSAGSNPANERFLEDTQKRQAIQEKLDLKTLPAKTLTEMAADSLQRARVLQRFAKEGPTANFNDAKLVGKAKVLLPKMQEMSRAQYAAMQNATFIEQKANVQVTVSGKQSEVLQYTATNFNQAARDYLLTSMRTNDTIKQMGFKSVAFVHDGGRIEKIDL